MDPHTPLHNTPSKRQRLQDENTPLGYLTPTPTHPTHLSTSITTTSTRLPISIKKQWSNGYLKGPPKPPAYDPYTPSKVLGKTRAVKSFAFPVNHRLRPKGPLSSAKWTELAQQHNLLKHGETLREFQIEGANIVLARDRDLCVVAPTGAGKSMLWMLPLVVQRPGISLVIVPFTTLGFQGERRHRDTFILSTFLHSGGYDEKLLKEIAGGGVTRVIYSCVEMIEHPAIAHLLHSESFRAQLSGVYLDEAHVVHESVSWRPAYSRLHILRRVLGPEVPLIVISATLPSAYRTSLELYAGLRNNYHYINLGNFRPELSVIVKQMHHKASSFIDLTFVIPTNSIADNIPSTIIYCDDLEILTMMFWWARTRLIAMGLPGLLVDILHAGLSDEHQAICTADFIAGRTKILLGSEKIGAGMDFPNVTLVVQYRCRGLSLVRWEQRRGRGARRQGMSAVGVLLVENSMAGLDEGSVKGNTKKSSSEDPGMVELAHSLNTPDKCIEAISDKWLENPSREGIKDRMDDHTRRLDSHHCHTRCSNCNPQLHFNTQYHWIMEHVNVHKTRVNGSLSDTEHAAIFDEMVIWRHNLWKNDWSKRRRRYGPDYLVSDHDLREISKAALTISNIDHLDSIAQILHLDKLAPSLLTHLHQSVIKVCGAEALEHLTSATQTAIKIPETCYTTIAWAPNPGSSV